MTKPALQKLLWWHESMPLLLTSVFKCLNRDSEEATEMATFWLSHNASQVFHVCQFWIVVQQIDRAPTTKAITNLLTEGISRKSSGPSLLSPTSVRRLITHQTGRGLSRVAFSSALLKLAPCSPRSGILDPDARIRHWSIRTTPRKIKILSCW